MAQDLGLVQVADQAFDGLAVVERDGRTDSIHLSFTFNFSSWPAPRARTYFNITTI